MSEAIERKPPFGGISCQVRAAQAANEADLRKVFESAVVELGSELKTGSATDYSNPRLVSRTRDTLLLKRRCSLPLTTALWARGDDEILVLTFQPEPFERVLTLVDELTSFLVDVLRLTHQRRPIRAALIGEEVSAAARLVDLWGTELQPKRGDQGTLWPTNGELEWFPLKHG